MQLNFKKEVKLSEDNMYTSNPVIKGDVKRKKLNGKYVYEKFYLINFFDIKEDAYVISSFGRVFSLLTNIEMKVQKDASRSNYSTVMLKCKDGNKYKFPVHCLVAAAFIPKTNSDKKMNRIYVHHKNWDNDYNYYWNLEWRSPSEIVFIGQIQNDPDMEDDDLARIVCKLLENKESVDDIFDILGGAMSKYKIWKIKKRLAHRTVSDDYNF